MLLLEEAAERVCGTIETRSSGGPIHFRHYLELELKYLIREFQELDLGVPLATHRLRKSASRSKGFRQVLRE